MPRLTSHTNQISAKKAAPFVALALVAGVIVVLWASAAALLGFEAESGTVSGGAAKVSLTGSSGGSAVSFNSASPTSAPTPAPTACPAPKRVVTAADVAANANSGYPAGTQLFVPGGPDPWGGCFPGIANTGVPAGVTLAAYTGPCTITAANTTIDAKAVNCDLSIRASNVVIKNSKITSGDISVDNGSFTLQDSEVNLGSNINAEGLKGSNFTVLRSNLYGGKRQVWCISNCVLQDSYLHDQLSDPSGVTHESSARVQEATTFRHNSFLCNAPDFPPDAGCSANQTGYPDFAPIHDVTLDKNLYMATTGGYCSYGGATAGKPYSSNALNATNIVSTNNVFARGTKPNDRSSIALTDKRRYTCGYYGVTTAYASNKTGFVFSGNRWDDGLLFSADNTYPYGSFTE